MNVYAGATEDIHYDRVGSPIVNTAPYDHVMVSLLYRPGFARCSLLTRGGITRTDYVYFSAARGKSSTDFWVTAQTATQGQSVSGDQLPIFGFLIGANVPSFGLYNTVGNPLFVDTMDAALHQLAGIATGMVFPTSLIKLDVHVRTAVNPVLEIYIGGALFLSYTGTIVPVNTPITGIVFGGPSEIATGRHFSEVLWAQEDTRSIIGVRNLIPVDLGHTSAWGGSASDVNETILDHGTVATTVLPSQTQEYTIDPTGHPEMAFRLNSTHYNVGDLFKVSSNADFVFLCTSSGSTGGSLPASYAAVASEGTVVSEGFTQFTAYRTTVENGLAVGSVIVEGNVTSGYGNMNFLVRTGGADFPGASFTTGAAILNVSSTWGQNPSTHASWTTDDINDPEFNIGVESGT
jgi:hypothetical protein